MAAGRRVLLAEPTEGRAAQPIEAQWDARGTSLAWINPSESALLAEGTRRGAVLVYDLRNARAVASFVAFPVFAKEQPKGREIEPSMVVDWDQNAGWLGTAGTTQIVKVWNLESEQLAACRSTAEETPVVALRSVEPREYVCGMKNGHVLMMDMRMSDVQELYRSPGKRPTLVGLAQTAPNLLAIAEFDGWIRFLDRRNASKAVSERFVAPSLTSLECQPALSMMVTSSLRSELRVMDCEGETKQIVRSMKGFRTKPLGNVLHTAIHPLSGAVACSNAEGVVCLYE